MKKAIKILALLFLSTIAHAQSQIDSIQFIGTSADSLEFMIHSSANIEVFEYNVEYKEESDNIVANILYSAGWNLPDCYCPIQTLIKIEKEIYQKAVVSIMIRYPIGGVEENPEYSDEYQLIDSKEIDLENITSIHNLTISNKISIFPNPAKNYLHFKTEKQFEIFDIMGKKQMLRKTHQLNAESRKENVIDISNLKAGLYFIKFEDGCVEKFVKK